jgi:flavin-dependent dehydrogenase
VFLVALSYGYFGVVNVDDNLANVAIVVDTHRISVYPAQLPKMVEDEAKRASAGHDLPLHLAPCSPILAASPVEGRMRSNTRIVLAGDAAKIVEPFTGEGIMIAMLGGMRAAAGILKAEGINHELFDLPIRSTFALNLYPKIMANPTRLNAMIDLMGKSERVFKAGLRRVLG